MQPFHGKEYKLFGLEHKVPFDASKAIADTERIINLASSVAPIKITCNQFRELQMGRPYPMRVSYPNGELDPRGDALVSDPDDPQPGDDDPTPEEVQALWARILADNAGAYARGELHTLYPELTTLLQVPNPAEQT